MALIESFSGIRGIYEKELTDHVAVKYAYSFSKFLKENKNPNRPNGRGIFNVVNTLYKTTNSSYPVTASGGVFTTNKKSDKPIVVIGMDTRKSGKILRNTLIEGLNCNIIDVGILPTAAIENAVREFKADAGIIITASHNEPEYNGFKFLDKDGAVLRPKDIEKIIDIYHELDKFTEEEFLSDFLYTQNEVKEVKRVEIKHKEALNLYIKFIHMSITKKGIDIIKNSKVKLVIDPNGGTGTIIKEILEELNIKAEYINMEQATFNRKIEPNEQSLKPLKEEIKKHNADFAAGFDCDADRVEIMLDSGELVSGNEILAIITDDILSELNTPEKETVVVNDATSYVVKDIVSSHKAKWKEVEVGEINVIDTMLAFNSPVGGEGSNGGVIIPPSRCRDGILTILLLLKIIEKKQKPLKELVEELEKYHYLKEKVALKKDFKELKEKIKQHYLDNSYLIEETGDETGGLKAIKDNSWVWFRQSKTEDKILRIIADSKDEKIAKEMIKEGKKVVKAQ